MCVFFSVCEVVFDLLDFCENAEAVWQLGLGAAEESYPQRPDEADCTYYLRTGFCGFGSRCRFNHPRDRGAVISFPQGFIFSSFPFWFGV